MSNDALTAVLARTSHVLLDFDGPVCSVFSNFTPGAVAKELRARLCLNEATESNEPFDVLEYVAHHEPSAAVEAEAELARLETKAVATAAPTPGALDVLRHFADIGRPIVVVSNNSAAAIHAYIDQHALARYIAGVSARTAPAPDLLKPNPHLLLRAIELLGTTPVSCLMIGDSETDIAAARAAGTPVVAYANKPGKRARFSVTNPNAIVDRITEFLPETTALR
ncbi:MAG: hypothetical protein QOI21_1330 [Actinomycetota bacterium]|nr:hypothetical protein [Actinomycetota bacterium]